MTKDYLGMRYAIPVNRGRAAIEIALRAMNVGENADVVIPSYVCHEVLVAVKRAGARPVFADVGPGLHVTPETIKAAITENTKCIIVPHLFGNTAPIDEIQEMLGGMDISLIDDAAQSFGAKCSGHFVGTFGDCGIISIGPGKALAGAAGGLLVTDKPEIYERAREIHLNRESASEVFRRVSSFWIWRRFRKYTLPLRIVLSRLFGPEKEAPYTPSTMSNIDGAIAIEQFHAFERNTLRRRQNANMLVDALKVVENCIISNFSKDTTIVKLVVNLPPNGLTVDEIITRLRQVGIESQQGYRPCHLESKDKTGSLPTTEDIWERIVCIPIDTGLKNSDPLLAEVFLKPGTTHLDAAKAGERIESLNESDGSPDSNHHTDAAVELATDQPERL